jgi:hypothetical protein
MEQWTVEHRMFAYDAYVTRVILRFGDIPWPPRSPDLSTCDFFLWGYLKSRVYAHNPLTLADLKETISRKWQQLIVRCWTAHTPLFSKGLHSRRWTPPVWHYISLMLCISNGITLRSVFFCNKTFFLWSNTRGGDVGASHSSFKIRTVPVGHPLSSVNGEFAVDWSSEMLPWMWRRFCRSHIKGKEIFDGGEWFLSSQKKGCIM